MSIKFIKSGRDTNDKTCYAGGLPVQVAVKFYVQHDERESALELVLLLSRNSNVPDVVTALPIAAGRTMGELTVVKSMVLDKPGKYHCDIVCKAQILGSIGFELKAATDGRPH